MIEKINEKYYVVMCKETNPSLITLGDLNFLKKYKFIDEYNLLYNKYVAYRDAARLEDRLRIRRVNQDE